NDEHQHDRHFFVCPFWILRKGPAEELPAAGAPPVDCIPLAGADAAAAPATCSAARAGPRAAMADVTDGKLRSDDGRFGFAFLLYNFRFYFWLFRYRHRVFNRQFGLKYVNLYELDFRRLQPIDKRIFLCRTMRPELDRTFVR